MTSTSSGGSKGKKDETSRPDAKPSKRSRSRSQGAMNDAQQSLNSLLKPQADSTQPTIISPSGAVRNQTRGRVAAPESTPARPSNPTASGAGQLLEGGDKHSSDGHLALVPGAHPLYDDNEIHSVPQTRVQMGIALASQQLQIARDRAGLLLGSVEGLGMLDLDDETLHTSRRAASKWASRYATHLVILLVVTALVGFGGLKSMTVQGTYPNGLQGAVAYTSTDQLGDDDAGLGKIDPHSPDYNVALPRTELGGSDAAANSRIVQPGAQTGDAGQEGAAGEGFARDTVTTYTVAQGDTIQSVADKFQVLPETIMGSNAIYDPDQELAAGSTLIVPPMDGMYYVTQDGDTLTTLSRRFQVDPTVISNYPPNNMADGVVKPEQPIMVPGGMMPQRDVTVTYTVKAGDSLKEIAARFGVDVPTMIQSNDIPDPDNLQIGSQLRVLPVAGIEYKVQKGDTVLSIADKLGVTPQMILDYSPNRLTTESVLQVDQVIMVPGGNPERPQVVAAARIAPVARGAERPVERQPSRPEPPKSDTGSNSGNTLSKPAAPVAPKPLPKPNPNPQPTSAPQNTYKAGTGRMVWPVNGTITQYFSSRHNGLDIAIAAGTPIHAADSGKVIWSGWRTDGLGYCVIIDHMNGLLTVYGHQIRQPRVYVGQYVDRGQVIGWIGSTGHSTGPHVHFMVKVGSGRNYRNPLAYLGGR